MRLAPAALLLAAAVPALGAATGEVRRGDLIVHVPATGTVVPADVFRLKSTIEARVESVAASSDSWHKAGEPLAMLTNKELTALVDARGDQSEGLLEDRWSQVYRPTPTVCRDACYVLKVYARPHAWVKPQAVLFEAAGTLQLVGRVRPEDAHLIRDGMTLTFWSVRDPKRRLTGTVERFVLDVQGEKEDPGGTFTVNLAPNRSLDPGTEWEGDIIPLERPGVLIVPTASLIVHDGATYLPVRVSTGVTTTEFTEIAAGAEEKREILILDDSQLRGEARHAPDFQRATLVPRASEPGASAPAERQPTTIESKGYQGDDPYGEQ